LRQFILISENEMLLQTKFGRQRQSFSSEFYDQRFSTIKFCPNLVGNANAVLRPELDILR
jgi:hypothetical protein